MCMRGTTESSFVPDPGCGEKGPARLTSHKQTSVWPVPAPWDWSLGGSVSTVSGWYGDGDVGSKPKVDPQAMQFWDILCGFGGRSDVSSVLWPWLDKSFGWVGAEAEWEKT